MHFRIKTEICHSRLAITQRDDHVDPYSTFPIHARPRPAVDVFADGVQRTQFVQFPSRMVCSNDLVPGSQS